MTRSLARPGVDPAEVYRTLGPITEAERGYLSRMNRRRRLCWFSNIYGITSAAYAERQYRRGAR